MKSLLNRITSYGFIDDNYDLVCDYVRRFETPVIPVRLQTLAAAALRLCNESRQLIAVGNSAQDITRFWPMSYRALPLQINVLKNSRQRENRILEASSLKTPDAPRYLIDDVAVSGMTLAAARCALSPLREDDVAIVGMAFKSKRLARRAGTVKAAITYSQENGGRTPINTLQSLKANTTLRQEYAQRYFNEPLALEEIAALYKGDALCDEDK